MMALKLLPILQVIIILCSPTYSYPTVYGTKRYGRLQRGASVPSWSTPTAAHLQPYQQMVRTQRYPVNYYDLYPYGQSYPDEYYYPTYPVYYPPARTSKYEVYQAVLPYYYDRPLMQHSGFGYYDDLGDEDQDAQPIGQETYYENNEGGDNFNDVNAAFLQNLIMSEMYKDSLKGNGNANSNNEDVVDDDDDDDEVYGKLDEYPPVNPKGNFYNEDRDVLELKQLARSFMQMPQKPKPEPTDQDRLNWFDASMSKKQQKQMSFYEDSINKRALRANALPERKHFMSSTVSPVTTSSERRDARGQKEVVMPRPATPVKHPFNTNAINNRVMGVVTKKDRQRTPSVYDTIKHMLDMEKSLENGEEQLKPKMRKRIVSSEDSLTHQLSVLKKQ